MTVVEKNKELIERYPWLKPRNVQTGEDLQDYGYSYTLLDKMPTGWRKAFGEQMCEEIQNELVKFNYVDEYFLTDIKEECGILRWYDEGYPVGRLEDTGMMLILTDRNFPESNNPDKDYWELLGKNELGKWLYKHYNIIEKCHIGDIISKYEDMSQKICINCGQPATMISKEWISPWCDNCLIESEHYIPIETYFKEIENADLIDE